MTSQLKSFPKKTTKIKILKILERTGEILKIYRSGKVPKILTVIINLEKFEEFIWYTRPDRWSTHAFLALSRLFFQNLDDEQLKRYCSLIIVPRLQEDILQKKKFSSQLFLTLKLSCGRHKIYFSSILIPMSLGQICREKEAAVLGLIMSSQKFPIQHIICLLTILLKDTPFSLHKILIIRSILTKNYIFPIKILEIFVDFFVNNKKNLKFVKFRKCYLVFFKIYYRFLSQQEKKKIVNLLN